ncbi:NUDIX hydrolase [Acidithiobacillus montserratensis]|uniref:NUDIX hydrolase n=1 Tax=Acidithiobacillus montserratensis TaxID=2729135 RepID=A0ACD5HEF4_9PROT|nr:NUDIX hydrolase [Acidithiobacillus montserratensis]MBN2680162.1 NUDIX hydrolase [Acidithiobacillaceae bacterium]MBU2748796.1 NUDIX hydrolase [Acidithiobacillus montserratensis]
MVWKPHVTVAAVVEDAGRFLLVEEMVEGRRCFNQPAGHWDPGESLLDAVIRETLEETAYAFEPEYLTGIYHWEHPGKDLTYLRFAFGGKLGPQRQDYALDTGIIGPVWMLPAEVDAAHEQLRNVMVRRCITDYLAGKRYPLEILHSLTD